VTGVDAALAEAGFDIVHRFDAAAVARELELPALAGAPLGILIGNTRALWPIFMARGELDVADPLERYTERAIQAVLPAGARCWFSHQRYDGAFLPFQRLAVATGLGSLSPIQLVIHPTYGPWFALRAVVVCDGSPPATFPLPPVCRCDATCHDAWARAVATSDDPKLWRAWLAVRDSCHVGQSWRYGDSQLVYHYTKRFSDRCV
jgi:hypothetical protein